jgi:hypothetical protein
MVSAPCYRALHFGLALTAQEAIGTGSPAAR